MDKAPRGPVGVLLSGDTGFYSGAKGLWPLLGNHEVITIPGISSLSYFCARLQTTWQDARLVSAHGRSHNAVGEIQRSAKVFALTGGATKAEDICRALAERGLGQVRVSVGERLSYADERIVTGTAAELAGETFADLSVLLAVNPDPVARPWNGSGLPDGAFLRGDVPMTKEEVRALALSKLRLEAHHVVWDVGAGTGSVSVECALSCPAGRVYAVEKKEEALALLAENRARFHAANLEVVAGTAPEALEALPAPDRVFLGGTSGSLEDILNVIFRKNPAARVVCTAVTLETVGEAARCFAGLEGADMVQVAVTRHPARRALPPDGRPEPGLDLLRGGPGMSAPRLLLCAPASGGGKTTVTCALLQALVNRGAGPVAFKCGPDYIDPMFHSEIIGAKSRNLDLFFLGRDTARYLLEKNSRGSGLALIEGVMGYYDGIGLSADASAYDLARATGHPGGAGAGRPGAGPHRRRRGEGNEGFPAGQRHPGRDSQPGVPHALPPAQGGHRGGDRRNRVRLSAQSARLRPGEPPPGAGHRRRGGRGCGRSSPPWPPRRRKAWT